MDGEGRSRTVSSGISYGVGTVVGKATRGWGKACGGAAKTFDEVIYATTRSLRRVPSAEWTIAQILDVEDASSVVRRFVDGFDWSMMQADPTQTLREAQAARLGQNRRMTTEELAACDAALRALAE